MNEGFKIVCLFGFSPHFHQIVSFLDSIKVKCFVVYSSRQKHAIESLMLPKSAQKICIDSLRDASYQKIDIRNCASIGISFGSPFIFKQKDIDDFQGCLINSHGAPLPEFKGGGGFSWRILQRDKRGSILMHLVTTEIDEGAYVYRKNFTFSESERIPDELEKRQLAEESTHLIPWIKQVVCGQIKLKKLEYSCESIAQPGSYFPRLSTALHGGIDWSLVIKDLESFVHAFSRPYPGAYTFLKGGKVRIMDLRIEKECFMHPLTHGLILDLGPKYFYVACNGGCISMQYDDCVIENSDIRLKAGDRFFTPPSILQKALASRAFYNPNGLVISDYASDLLN